MNKSEIHSAALEIISSKIKELKAYQDDLTHAQQSNSKSTAGDKHDTERAMVQIEMDNYNRQLEVQKQQERNLKSISPELGCSAVGPGALIKTEKGLFFISVPLGKITLNKIDVWLISPGSPMGQALMGKKVGEPYVLNGGDGTVLEIQ